MPRAALHKTYTIYMTYMTHTGCRPRAALFLAANRGVWTR